MKIKNFKATNVHGHLEYDINLDDKLTFLIGINGSGKTSVLKLILGLISPSHNYLSSVKHDSAKLICVNENNEIIEISTKKLNDFKYEISLKEGKETISDNFKSSLAMDEDEYGVDEQYKKNSRLIHMFDRLKVVQEIKRLSTPLYLGLDRRVYQGQQIDKIHPYNYGKRRYRHFSTNDPLNRSLMDIQEIIYDYFRLIASKQPVINEDFKNKILHQSFEFIQTSKYRVWDSSISLSKKRKEAIDAFKNLKIQGITKSVNGFFNQLENTFSQFTKIEKNRDSEKPLNKQEIETFQKWFNNQPQLKRIDELIEYNQAYQSEIEKLYEPIEKVKKMINDFFHEGRKELIIDSQGELHVKYSNNNIVRVFELSSGEKQIVTMLGHLIFFVERSVNEPGIFIIDEPEVSLHLAWQEIFVKAIQSASPNTQFILATHSPAIIGSRPHAVCKDLAESN